MHWSVYYAKGAVLTFVALMTSVLKPRKEEKRSIMAEREIRARVLE